MKRLLPIVLIASLLFATAPAIGDPQYGWMVSKSSTEPCVNSGTFSPGGIIELFLWYAYNTTEGITASAMTATVDPPGALNLLGFNVAGGIINAGTTTDLLLAMGGCPNAPFVVGKWIAVASAPEWEHASRGPVDSGRALEPR
jgi:hypothetical protein